MKRKFTVLLSIVLLLLSSPSLEAEEFALTLEKAGPQALICRSYSTPDDNGCWINKEAVLSDKALTFCLTLAFEGEGPNIPTLLVFDNTGERGEQLDILYVDMNGNATIDENESFDLKLMNTEDPAFPIPSPFYCAEKVRISKGETRTVDVNIYFHLPPSDSREEGARMWITSGAWGWYEGNVTLDGKRYRAILKDFNINGSFSDFSGFMNDSLLLIPESDNDVDALNTSLFLKRKILVDYKAYSLDVKDNGATLVLEALDEPMGALTVQPAHAQVRLRNNEWGSCSIRGNQKAPLPEGTWSFSSFSVESESGLREKASYGVNSKIMTLDIVSGKATSLSLDLELTADFSASINKDGYRLSLNFATAQGARLRGYSREDEELAGIPFKIVDKTGAILHEACFEFG